VKSAIRNFALLFVGCVIFHVIGTWNLPLIDRDEPRFAEASREMIERGDYIVPYFNNQVRLDKPPLAYWAQVASYRVFGENDFAARFPSAVAAALTALTIFAWGSRFPSLQRVSASEARDNGARVGWWAAIIFTLSLQTFLHAKAAVADMWLVLFMTIAHWSGYELIQRSTSNAERVEAPVHRRAADSRWWWIFYASLAFAFLAKGPIGWVPLATVAATKFFLRDAHLAGRFKFARGILFMLAIVALWGVPALIQTHGEFFLIGIGRHVVGRSFVTMEGHGANSLGMYLLLLPFYFVTVFISFFPWSIKLPWLMGKLWRSRAAGVTAPGYSALDNIDKYLIAGTAIIFIIFTLVKTKLPHYTLPAFPLLALLLARRSAAENATHFFRNCALVSASVYLAIAIVVPPFVARLFPAQQLFQQSRIYLQPDMQFGSVDFQEPSLVWYFRSRVHGFLMPLNNRRTAEFMGRSGPRFVVLPTSMVRTLFTEYPENWKMFSTRGFNIAKGKRVDLTLVLKPE
jgi:4-amino-4-deoxy-L-arabinose transferase-like glycosyltransferase